jgi:hypothetical protein
MNKYQKAVLVAVAIALVIVYFTPPLMFEFLRKLVKADYGHMARAIRPLSYMTTKIIIVLIIGAIFFFFFMGKDRGKEKGHNKTLKKLMKKKRREDVENNP